MCNHASKRARRVDQRRERVILPVSEAAGNIWILEGLSR
jgi:hypothetical protein